MAVLILPSALHSTRDATIECIIVAIAIFHILTTSYLKFNKHGNHNVKPDLYEAVRNRRWNTVRRILQDRRNRDQAQYVTKGFDCWHGFNPLHCACLYHDTPADVVRLLLAAFTEATMVRDEKGCFPLHYAARYSSDEIVMMVLEAYPDATSLQDNVGCSPLLIALHAERSPRIISSIIKADPSMILAPDVTQNTPVNQFFSSWNSRLITLVLFGHIPISHVLNLSVTYRTGLKGKVKDIYKQTYVFLEIMEKITCNTPFLVAHASLKNTYPLSFFHLLLRVHPEQAWEFDCKGNLLLHSLATSSYAFRICVKAIDFLLSLNPQAASVPNPEGRLVLNLAIEKENRYYEKIFLAAPRAINTSDIKTHMLPFMTAAIDREQTSDEKNIDHDEESIGKFSLVYELLMKDPTMVSFGIPK